LHPLLAQTFDPAKNSEVSSEADANAVQQNDWLSLAVDFVVD
jgi:hypothetical protein